MNKEPLRQKLDAGDYLGIVEHLINEVERLEALLEAERMYRKQEQAKLAKAEHDRDRYRLRLKEHEVFMRNAAEVFKNCGSLTIYKGV